jgi:hypothetical protein
MRRATKNWFGWPMAAVVIAAMVIAATGWVVHRLMQVAETTQAMPERMAESFGKALAPKVTVNNVVLTTVTSMQQKSKLVVLDTTIDVDVTKDESYSAMGFMYLGTNRVRLIARENRIQYVIGLEKQSAADFAFDDATKRLTITVPRPRLDEEMISVQSDPAKCYAAEYEGGWMRFDLRETLKHTQEMLRPALIAQGKNELVKHEAERAGLAAVRKFVEPMTASLREDGVKV